MKDSLQGRWLAQSMAVALLLTSCGAKPLTETECASLAMKQAEFVIADAPPEARSTVTEVLSGDMDAVVARCAAGKIYKRKDYNCVVSAADQGELGKCLREAGVVSIRHVT
jgi:hypothetical protein